MRTTIAGEAFLATLAPERAAWLRDQFADVPEMTDDEARRLAIALGLRPADTDVTSVTPRNGVATPKNVATPQDQESADSDAFPGYRAEFHDPQDEHPTGLAALLHHHGTDTPERGGQ